MRLVIWLWDEILLRSWSSDPKWTSSQCLDPVLKSLVKRNTCFPKGYHYPSPSAFDPWLWGVWSLWASGNFPLSIWAKCWRHWTKRSKSLQDTTHHSPSVLVTWLWEPILLLFDHSSTRSNFSMCLGPVLKSLAKVVKVPRRLIIILAQELVTCSKGKNFLLVGTSSCHWPREAQCPKASHHHNASVWLLD